MDLSIVIPVYNEVEALPSLYVALVETLDRLNKSAEIIFANDGSTDGSGPGLDDCTLKVYRREVVEDVRLYGEMHRFIPIYAAWEGASVAELPVGHHPRRFGKSKYGLARVARVLLDLFILYFIDRAFDRPIQFFG